MDIITDKTKKNVLVFLLVIIILTICFIFFKFILKDGLNPFASQEDLVTEQKKQDQATMEKTADVVKAQDPAQCDSVDKIVNGINYKTVCLNNIYYNMSADNLDYGACEKLVDMSVEDCQKRVMLMSFSKEKDLAVCDKVPEKLKPSCPDAYWNFSAIDQKDPTLCTKTSTSENNTSCQNNALVFLASKKGTTIQCSSFADIAVKADCENYLKGEDNCDFIKNALLNSICSRLK